MILHHITALELGFVSRIVAAPAVTSENGTIEEVFWTFDEEGRTRTQWLVQHNRDKGNLY